MAAKSADGDRRMAAHMKAKGITRTTKRCPISHCVIPVGMDVAQHAAKCGGRYQFRKGR